MKIRFTRTPPANYSAYVEGEEADIDEVEARYLVGLNVAAHVTESEHASTKHVSSRTEIVGEGNRTEVVVTGRGANIKTVSDPESAKLDPPGGAGSGTTVTDEMRMAASKESATGLVKQEASRTGGFIDETKPALPTAQEAEKEAAVQEKEQTDAEKAAEKEAAAKAKKSSGAAPENK